MCNFREIYFLYYIVITLTLMISCTSTKKYHIEDATFKGEGSLSNCLLYNKPSFLYADKDDAEFTGSIWSDDSKTIEIKFEFGLITSISAYYDEGLLAMTTGETDGTGYLECLYYDREGNKINKSGFLETEYEFYSAVRDILANMDEEISYNISGEPQNNIPIIREIGGLNLGTHRDEIIELLRQNKCNVGSFTPISLDDDGSVINYGSLIVSDFNFDFLGIQYLGINYVELDFDKSDELCAFHIEVPLNNDVVETVHNKYGGTINYDSMQDLTVEDSSTLLFVYRSDNKFFINLIDRTANE